MMAKIRLTEEKLRDMVEEAVRGIVNEIDWRTRANAASVAQMDAENGSGFDAERRQQQAKRFNKSNTFNDIYDQYGISYDEQDLMDKHQRFPDSGKFTPGNGTYKKYARKNHDVENFYAGKQGFNRETNKWEDHDWGPGKKMDPRNPYFGERKVDPDLESGAINSMNPF